jgi:hypothetical protein
MDNDDSDDDFDWDAWRINLMRKEGIARRLREIRGNLRRAKVRAWVRAFIRALTRRLMWPRAWVILRNTILPPEILNLIKYDPNNF